MPVPRHNTGRPGEASDFYPPRARWYSGLVNLGYLVNQKSGLDALSRQFGIGTPQLLLSIALPGAAYFVLGRRRWGQAVVSGYVLAAFLFVAGLGYPVAYLAMGAMISLHAASLLHLLSRWPAEMSPRRRIAISLSVFLATGLLIYAPLQTVLMRHFFLPLRIQSRVVVVSVRARQDAVMRGDLIAYRISPRLVGNVRLRAGYGLGRVEAVAGDHIQFGEDTYSVAGARRPRRVHMPQNTEYLVPQNHWFIWPDSVIGVAGNATDLPRAMQGLALVPASQFVGKPFRRWCWRRQVEP